MNKQININEFDSNEVIKRKGLDLYNNCFRDDNVTQHYNRTQAENRFLQELEKFSDSNEKVVLINEILLHVSNALFEHNKKLPLQFNYENEDTYNTSLQSYNYCREGFENVFFFLRNQLKLSGVTIANDSFTITEVINLTSKVDSIIDKLEELKIGQKVIFNHFDEVIGDFKTLKPDLILGKKRWYQLVMGKVLSFVAEKGGDELLEALKPYIAELLKHSPHYLNSIVRMIE